MCIPRKYSPDEPMVTFNVNLKDFTVAEYKEKIEKLCFNITRWNIGRRFHLTQKKNFGNTQDFVESQLMALNQKLIISPQFNLLLKAVKTIGLTKLRFNPAIDFAVQYNIKEKTIKFKKHEVLDDIVDSFMFSNPQFAEDHPHEHQLFKAFDQFFWLKFLHNEQERKSGKLARNAMCGKGMPLITCPFKKEHSVVFVKDEDKIESEK